MSKRRRPKDRDRFHTALIESVVGKECEEKRRVEAGEAISRIGGALIGAVWKTRTASSTARMAEAFRE